MSNKELTAKEISKLSSREIADIFIPVKDHYDNPLIGQADLDMNHNLSLVLEQYAEAKLKEAVEYGLGYMCGKHNLKLKKKEINRVSTRYVNEVCGRRVVACEDPMVCLRGCSVDDQTCKHPIYKQVNESNG